MANHHTMSKLLFFRETQRFNQFWIWLVMTITWGAVLTGFYYDAIEMNHSFWDVITDVHFIIVMSILLPVTMLLLLIKMETAIRKDGVWVRFFPFHRSFRKYSWHKLSEFYVRKYRPIGEFGGWGLRGLGKNRVMNVRGNMGLQLEFKDGKKLLIGTQKPKDIERVLSDIWKRNN